MKKEDGFCGYERTRRIGVRNDVLILPTVICSGKVALRIAEAVRGCKVAYHAFGCCQGGEDFETTYRTLRNTADNPNVGSVLIVSLGCEKIPSGKLLNEISKTGKRAELLSIQDVGGTVKAVKKGIKIAKDLVKEISQLRRKAFNMSELTVAVECGASDWTSSISANPAVGYAVDLIIDHGGRVIFSETPEIVGAEHLLLKRVKDREVRNKLIFAVNSTEDRFKRLGIAARETNLSRGNMAGGITTLEEKSLGAICKAGSKTLEGVLLYAEEIPRKSGLYFMDTPGQDVESVTGMVAGGAQIAVFTTGLGTPTGNPIAPVIKVTGNPDTYRKLKDNIDVNAGTIIEGKESIDQVADRIYRKISTVASFEETKSEILGHHEFSILKPYPSF